MSKTVLWLTIWIEPNRVFFLTYSQPETGFWDSLWSDEETIDVPLTEGDYQVVLTKAEVGTLISWRDSEGKVLSAEQSQRLASGFSEDY